MRDRLYIAGYALILVLAALGLRHMWLRHEETILLLTEDGIGDTVNQLNDLIEETSSHVNILRISAESTLADLSAKHLEPPVYYNRIAMAPDQSGYCTNEILSAGSTPTTPAVSGLGPLPAPASPLGEEIAMSLLLRPQFIATEQNIPNMAWAYYTSAQHFIALYPFAACADFRYSDVLHDHEFFSLGRPEVNPGHRQFWTSAYVDEAGKGLMATIGAPVYDKRGQFRGTVAIDLTLKTLSQYLRPREMTGGSLLIVNEQGQVLAHPSLVEADPHDAPAIKDFLPDYDADLRHIVYGSGEGFTAHGNGMYTVRTLSGAPWRLVYVMERGALHRQAWRQSGIEIAGFLLLAALIIAFETARRNSHTLKGHAAGLALATEQAQKAREEADSANRAKSLMMANVSHDLRTPLNAIIGFSEVMLRQIFGPLGNERYVGYAHDINTSGEMLLRIIDNLLDLSKAESGEYQLLEEVVDVGVLIERCRSLVLEQAGRSGIKVEAEVASNLPAVKLDPRAMQRVLLNLLSNAIKFSRRGGTVGLKAWCDPKRRVTISVSDTGVGISKKDLEQLFRPFSRGASAMTANHEGTGLGLSIVKSLVELHGGKVTMDSALGIGTVVTIELPPWRNQRPDMPAPPPAKAEKQAATAAE